MSEYHNIKCAQYFAYKSVLHDELLSIALSIYYYSHIQYHPTQ